ncbi:unnamed protein product [Allacma fusca]|uniref:Uncharacterized protein n=1 Tax=Allacma fusca TaxID=39272 RepID=A0A8J2JDB5_9HEXA|nr:unnamed protein product [Allacma fusca]
MDSDICLRDTARVIRNVGFVCGKNGTNYIAAFKNVQANVSKTPDIDLNEVELGEKDEWFAYFFDGGEIADHKNPQENTVVIAGRKAWKYMTVSKLPCYNHLIKLILKDSMSYMPCSG